jgi:hypothetical protein
MAFDPEPRLIGRVVDRALIHRGKLLTPLSRQGDYDNRREYRDTSYPWGCSTMDEDYAVLTLADRLGDQFGWMGNMTYDSDYDDKPIFRTIGYADDIAGGKRPVYERDFHLDEDEFGYGEARAMTCGADFEKGQSGSPVFAFGTQDDQPYVVAVASAEGDDGNNYCAGGSWLTKLVREARQLDP